MSEGLDRSSRAALRREIRTCPQDQGWFGAAVVRRLLADYDAAVDALKHARPVVFNGVCSAKADNQPWQVEVRQKILDRVDAEIARSE